MFENGTVKGSEFLRMAKVIVTRKTPTFRWVPERGGGRHGTVYIGGRFAVVKDL